MSLWHSEKIVEVLYVKEKVRMQQTPCGACALVVNMQLCAPLQDALGRETADAGEIFISFLSSIL